MKNKFSRFTPYHNRKAFTLMEILIVIAIIVIIAIILLITLNPFTQIKKAWDSGTKSDLATLRNVLENYYNDKGCYPTPAQICFNPSSIPNSDGTYQCKICGKVSTPDAMKPYISTLPCSPQHPTTDYLYHVDNNTCPTSYQIYTILNNLSDPVINTVGCPINSCGPNLPYAYNYGVSSPNTALQHSNNYYCGVYNNFAGLTDCNACTNYFCNGPNDTQCCQNTCTSKKIYADFPSCCSANSNNSCGSYSRYCISTSASCIFCGNQSECVSNPSCAVNGNGKVITYNNNSCK